MPQTYMRARPITGSEEPAIVSVMDVSMAQEGVSWRVMTSIEKRANKDIQSAKAGSTISVAGAVVGILVLALALAVAWTLFAGVLGLVWLGFKIAIVLGAIVVVLVLVGMIRTHVVKR